MGSYDEFSEHYGDGGGSPAADADADDRRRAVRPIAPLPSSERERDHPQRLSRDTRRSHYGRQPETVTGAASAAPARTVQSMLINNSYSSGGSGGLHSSVPSSEPIYLGIENDNNLHQQEQEQYEQYQQHRLSQSLPLSSSSGRQLEYSSQPSGRQQRALHSSYESSVTRQQPVEQSPYHGQSQQYPQQPYQYPQHQHQPQQQHPQLNNNSSRKQQDITPIMFNDAYDGGSVITGMSQQDLLRKKSREHRNTHKKFKKKKNRILNLPAVLLGGGSNGGNNNNGGDGNNGGGVDKSKYLRSNNESSNRKSKATKSRVQSRPTAQLPAPASRTPQWMNPAASSSRSPYYLEEMEGSTAESTNESGEFESHALGYSYSGIQAQQGVMNERTDQWLVAPSDALANDPESDNRSLGESITSFPLLSTSAGKGIAGNDIPMANFANSGMDMGNGKDMDTGMDNHYDHNAQIVATAAPGNANTQRATDALQTPMSNRRGVRFAEKLATFRIVYDRYDAPDCLEIPWDEQNIDNRSPTSVREVSNMNDANYGATSKNDKTSVPTRPVSILRNRRYAAQVGSPNFERSRRFAGAVTSPLRTDASGIRTVQVPPAQNANAMARSPPRNAPDGFMDEDGSFLSPIRPHRISYDNKGPSPARGESTYGQGAPSEQRSSNAYYAARRVIHQQDRSSGYAETIGDGEIYPDPPLQLDFDDESTVVSLRTGFIEAVAAIVVQTAFRKHMAVRTVEQMQALSRVPVVPVPARVRTQPVGPAASTARSQPVVGPTPTRSVGPGPVLDRAQPVTPARTLPVDPSLGAFPVALPAESKEFESMAHRMYDLAAIQIQSTYRGFWVRDCLDVDHYCAAVIQKAFRRFRPRIDSDYDLFRIVIVQSIWRRNIARDNTSKARAHIVAIQAGFRGSRARRKLTRHLDRIWQADRTDRTERATRDAAALHIQSRWRSYDCETRFIRSLVDILIVQTIFRRWAAKRRVAVLRKARAKRIATRNLVKQVDYSQRMQKQLENRLDISYDEPGQINTSAVQGSPEEQEPSEEQADLQGPPEVYKNKRPTSEFKPVKQEEESDAPSVINTPAPKAVELPSIYSSPVGDERSDLAVRKVQEDDVPPGFTISVRKEATFADADSRAANASIEVAGNKVQEHDVPPAVTIPVRRDAKPPVSDFKPVRKESDDLSFRIEECEAPPAISATVPREEKSESANFEFDDPGEARATNLLAMWKSRDEKNTLVIGGSKR